VLEWFVIIFYLLAYTVSNFRMPGMINVKRSDGKRSTYCPLLCNWLTNQRTKSMEHSPSLDANKSSASHILHILWNLTVHYRIHNSPPLWATLIPSAPPTLSYSFEVRFNIILPSALKSSKRSLSFRLSNLKFILISVQCYTCQYQFSIWHILPILW
jgi:hypothetical protein